MIFIVISIMITNTINAQEDFNNPIVIGEIISNCTSYLSSGNTCSHLNNVAGESKDVVYQFTVSSEMTIFIDMCSSDYDSYVLLYNSDLIAIAENDDGCGSGSTGSFLTFVCSPGVYYIVCEGYETNCGVYELLVYTNEPPVPDAVSLPDVTGECSATITETPTATDECSGLIYGYTEDLLTYSGGGTYVVTWVFEDGNGGVSYQTQNIIITDNLAPVPDLATLTDITGDCSIEITIPTATDNCLGTVSATTNDLLNFPGTGTYTINWIYTDENENSSTQSQNVIITDNTAPVPDITTLPDVTGYCSVSAPIPSATDDCAGIILATTSDPLVYSTVGTYSITWNYNDESGNSSAQTQNVIVNYSGAPIPDLPELPALHGECSITADVPTATDNCSVSINGTTSDPTTYTEQGTYIINWTYNDGEGNIISQIQEVYIEDLSAPIPDITELPVISNVCSVTITDIPTATDNCGGFITATTEDPLIYNEVGIYVIFWIFDDGFGNIEYQTQEIEVLASEIICPDDLIVNLNDGETNYTVTADELNAAFSVESCNEDILTNSVNSGTTLAGEIFEIGTHHIVWTATYDAENIDTCEVVLTVNPFVSISEVNKVNYVVYPNPSDGNVFVYFEESNDISVIVKDAIGRIVYEKLENGNLIELELNGFDSGMYMLEIKSNNKSVFAKVILK